MRRRKGGTESYLRVQFVDLFNGCLDVPRVNQGPNLNTFLNRLQIGPQLDVGLDSEFTRSSRVAIGDEVVHDQVINVTRAWALAAVVDNQVTLIASRKKFVT